MSDKAYATSYEETTTTTSTTTGASTRVVDQQYVRGLPGLLKALEAGLSLIAFICMTASATICLPWVANNGFFCFITMACFITTLIHYVLLLFKLQHRIFICACVNWPVFEVGYFVGLLIMLFFGDLFVSISACTGAQKAAVAFGWFAFITYCVDAGFAVRALMAARAAGAGSQREMTTATTFTSNTTEIRY